MEWLLASVFLLAGLAWLGRRWLRGGPAPGPEGAEASGPDAAYEQRVDAELDLHGAPLADIEALVDAFVDDARQRGRTWVKIVHGKGTGRLRARVRSRLERHPGVTRCVDAASPGSGWGATIAHLAPSSEVAPRSSDG